MQKLKGLNLTFKDCDYMERIQSTLFCVLINSVCTKKNYSPLLVYEWIKTYYNVLVMIIFLNDLYAFFFISLVSEKQILLSTSFCLY